MAVDTGAMEAVVEEAQALAMDDQTHSAETELSGYYLPASTIAVGPIQLDHISLGMAFEFDAYLAGEADAFPPLMAHFNDTSSPSGTGELGNTYYEVTHRFEPSHFAVTDETLAFWGQHDVLGTIEFNGTFDAQQVAAMQNGDPHNALSALTGTMTIGDQTFENVDFQGWLGD
tara:strand:+ start:4926 stop:5444 length:519 start_codon:yes stop_codon:yes gene_type:complete